MNDVDEWLELTKKITADKQITLEVLSKFFGGHQHLWDVVATHVLEVVDNKDLYENRYDSIVTEMNLLYEEAITEKLEQDILCKKD